MDLASTKMPSLAIPLVSSLMVASSCSPGTLYSSTSRGVYRTLQGLFPGGWGGGGRVKEVPNLPPPPSCPLPTSSGPWASLSLPPYTCSGVVVSPRHLLTAAPCPPGPPGPPCPGAATIGGLQVAIAGVARHPLYRTGNATTPPRHDLALVELEEEVAVVAACLPAPGTRLEGRRGAVVRGG